MSENCWIHSRSIFVLRAELRLYNYLFSKADPDDVQEDGTWIDNLNLKSLIIHENALIERNLAEPTDGNGLERYQFERIGFFARDPDSTKQKPVFNLTVGLVDSFAAKTDQTSNEAKAKAEDKKARERAAEERRLKKEAKAKKEAERSAGVRLNDTKSTDE